MSGGDYLKKTSMAICDKDTEYMQRLGNYISKQENKVFQIYFFSDREYLKEALEHKKFDILVLGEDFLEIGECYAKQSLCIYLSDGSVIEEYSSSPILFKYQAADHILREIHYHWKDFSGMSKKIERFSEKKEMITVFSPLHEKLQTPFVFALAEKMAENAKVLYINFTLCCGFQKLCKLETGMDLGDLFYLIKEDQSRFFFKLKSSVYAMGDFFVIPPVSNPEILTELEKEELKTFLYLLRERTEYEVILLDLGSMLPGFFEILKESTKVWIPESENAYEKAAIIELERLIKKKEKQLEKKVLRILLPAKSEIEKESFYDVEKIMMSDVGRTAQKVLEDEGYLRNRSDFTKGFGSD